MDINLTLIGQSIAMIVFVWFTMTKIWPHIIDNLDQRRKTIADGLAAGDRAEKALVEAEAARDSMIAEARDQAHQIIEQANRRASALVEEGKADGQRERERQLVAAQEEIAQEKVRARDELRAQVSSIAIASAEKILNREIDAGSHQDILASLASEL